MGSDDAKAKRSGAEGRPVPRGWTAGSLGAWGVPAALLVALSVGVASDALARKRSESRSESRSGVPPAAVPAPTGPTLHALTAVPLARQPVLPLPAAVHDGDTIALDCGRTYTGTLDLERRRDVTVKTIGDCGPAVITPAQPVDGWRRDPREPGTWITDMPYAPALLELDGRYLPLAHHPNAASRWLKGLRISPDRLRANLPSADLAGANLVWRAADWLIQERRIARSNDDVLVLASGDDEGFGLLPQTEFYVEGKRWMMDQPGEWSWQDGQLALRMPDAGSPAQRVWAAPAVPAIAANDAQDIRIDAVVVRAAGIGIHGAGSQRLQISDVRIANCIEAAIIAGSGTAIMRVQVDGTVRHGIRANDDASDVSIRDSRIDKAGMLGMPKRSRGAIVFELASGHTVRDNHIADAAYIGIRVFRHARVTGNVIERACLRLSDCGGIYAFARDRAPLDTVIAHNRVHALGGSTSFGIYLDDFANGVLVQHNDLSRNPSGMQLHNGFGNRIEDNRFDESRREHILFNETAGFAAIESNRVTGNHFSGPASVPVFRLWSRHGGAHVSRFADFERNVYAPLPTTVAEIEGRGLLSPGQWRQWSGDGAGTGTGKGKGFGSASTLRASGTRPAPPRERQREQEQGVGQ